MVDSLRYFTQAQEESSHLKRYSSDANYQAHFPPHGDYFILPVVDEVSAEQPLKFAFLSLSEHLKRKPLISG